MSSRAARPQRPLAPIGAASKPDVDSSVHLLQRLFDDALGPQYLESSAARSSSSRARGWRWISMLVCLLVGVMVAASASLSGARAGAAGYREALLNRIAAAEQEHDALQQQVSELNSQIEALGRQAGLAPEQASPQLQLASASGAVSGPGVVLVIQEGVRRDDNRREQTSKVLDSDLRMVVNGLWQSGAEAVAINGQRVSTRTAIRSAGSAITVNYRSLIPPYRIEAIGDPKQLPAGFAASNGGQWLGNLRDNYAVSWTLTTSERIELAADQGIRADHVEAGR